MAGHLAQPAQAFVRSILKEAHTATYRRHHVFNIRRRELLLPFVFVDMLLPFVAVGLLLPALASVRVGLAVIISVVQLCVQKSSTDHRHRHQRLRVCHRRCRHLKMMFLQDTV